MKGSTAIADEYERGGVPEDPALEDIHMHVEHRLAELIGPPPGGCTPRARATTRSRPTSNCGCARDRRGRWSARALPARAGRPRRGACRDVMPGFTHLQSAQPVTLGHHLMAYYEMLAATAARFADARARMNECPLGAPRWPAPASRSTATRPPRRSASTGRPPTARRRLRPRLRARLSDAAAQCALHLSRLAEELILWASAAVRLRQTARRLLDRLVDHAAEAQSRRRRAGPRPFGRIVGALVAR
jgi:argininosuccinate lyase